jgi:hypothetical protein
MGDVGDIVADVWPDISQTIGDVSQTVLGLIRAAWPVIGSVVSTVMTAVKTVVHAVWPVVSNIIRSAVNTIKGIINGLKPILGVVKSIFDGVRNAIKNPIDAAKNAIKTAVDAIKGFFSGLHITIPKPKIPEVHVDGGEAPWGIAGKGRLPSFSVNWKARGGMVEDATLIGAGEKGTEFIWPKYNPYMREYAAAIAEHLDSGGVNVTLNYTGSADPDEVVTALSQGLRQLKATGAI